MTGIGHHIEPVGTRIRHRVRQFFTVASHRHNPAIDARIRILLGNDRQWALLARLAPYDRAHHLNVHDALVGSGHRDPDLLRAALLHDVGKADERGRVRLAHRVIRVIGRAVGPARLRHACHENGSWLRHGLYLAEHHAGLGAALARDAGASERVCWLISRHEDRIPAGDPDLDALIAADEGKLLP